MIIFKKQKHFKNNYVIGSGFVDIASTLGNLFSKIPPNVSNNIKNIAIPALTTAAITGMTGIGTTAINKLVDKVKKRIDNKKITPSPILDKPVHVSNDIGKQISEKSQEIINSLQSQNNDQKDINARVSGMGFNRNLKPINGLLGLKNKKIGKGIKLYNNHKNEYVIKL